MSEYGSEDEDEDVGGNPLRRVLRRSLNMKRGNTEKRALGRKSPQGWSERGQRLVDQFGGLITAYDRVAALADQLADEDDDGADPLLHRYGALVDDIDTLTGTQVGNKPAPRDQAILESTRLTAVAGLLERDMQDFLADNTDGNVLSMTNLLTSDVPGVRRLLQAAQSGRLQALIDKMPNTQATATALEQIEDNILTARTPSDNPMNGMITKEAHAIFYKKKTECMENEVFDKVDDSDNPKLDGLKDLPKGEYWKLLMDGRHQGGGDKHFFDQSQGYMASMMKGMNKIVDEVDEPMSVDFIQEMHTCSTYQVTEQSNDSFFGSARFQEQGLKKAPNGWGCCYDFSDEGVQELADMRTEMNLLVPGYFVDDVPETLKRGGIERAGVPKVKAGEGLRGRPPAEIQLAVETLMTNAIDRYQEALEEAKEQAGDEAKNDAKIGAIIDCCRRLGQVHPFKDANGRLMMFLLLNKMLLENQLSPTILADQGQMIGMSKAELIVKIKEGQQKVTGLKRT